MKTLKDLKAWRTTTKDCFKITRKSDLLEAKDKEIRDHSRHFHSTIDIVRSSTVSFE